MWSHYQRTIEGIEMNKTTEALKLAEEALEELHYSSGTVKAVTLYKSALAAIRETLAEPVTISCDCGDIYERNSFGGKFIQQYGCCPNCDAAEPVKQEPVAHYKDAPHTIYLQTGCDDPEDCECSFNEWGDTTWCTDQIHDTDIPYIRADYAAPVSAEPCKECDAKQAKIDSLMLEYCPDEITDEQMAEWSANQKPVSECRHCGWLCMPNDSHSKKWYPMQEPVKQEPVMDYELLTALREGEQNRAEDDYFNARPHNDTPTLRGMFCQGFERGFHKGLKYAAPLDAKAIREERTKELMQLFLDPENQPTQFGTATLEYRQEEHKAIRAEAYQKGRDYMKEEAAKEAWNLAPTDESAGEIAAAIRGLK